MADNQIAIRISIVDGDQAIAALQDIGDAGEEALGGIGDSAQSASDTTPRMAGRVIGSCAACPIAA